MARAPVGRQQLLDSARAALVAGNGQLDVSSVSRDAGLTTGALYHHFGSKIGLLSAVYDEFYRGVDEAVADEHLPVDGSWTQRERERVRRMVAHHYADPLAELVLSGSGQDPRLAELESAFIARMSKAMARNVRHGQRSGQLDRSIDARLAGAYVIGGLRLGIAQQLGLNPRPSVAVTTGHLWHLVAATTGAT